MRLAYAFFLTTTSAFVLFDHANFAPGAGGLIPRWSPPRVVVDDSNPEISFFNDARKAATSSALPKLTTSLAKTVPTVSPLPTSPTHGPTITPGSVSICTPMTICVDAMTCGHRYGGCYDKNFCTGTTSYPVPSVTCSPGAGRGRGGA